MKKQTHVKSKPKGKPLPKQTKGYQPLMPPELVK